MLFDVAFVEYTGLCNPIEIGVCFVFMAVDYCRFFIVLCHVYHLLQGVMFYPPFVFLIVYVSFCLSRGNFT